MTRPTLNIVPHASRPCDEWDRVLCPETGDEGFTLLAAIVMIFMVLLVLSVAAPRIGKQIQRDREQESAERAEQYTRAIRIYYQKFKHYPGSIDQLEKTNNQRFLRQKYDDPLTGKPDWRIIHVGENQTQVKGFFGEDLPGIAPMSGGSGIGTPIGGSGGSAFGGSGPIGTPIGGAPPTAPGQAGTGTGTGTGTSTGTGTTGSTGSSSDQSSGAGGGPIMGVGSAKSGEAMLVVNEQTTYETWEFLYDPRIEQLYAKSTLLGGIPSGTGTTGGFGTMPGTGSPSTPTGTAPTVPGANGGAGTTPTGP